VRIKWTFVVLSLPLFFGYFGPALPMAEHTAGSPVYLGLSFFDCWAMQTGK
jgi:hypothetical protein